MERSLSEPLYNFNSTIVRLKANPKEFQALQKDYFNSTIVRLKGIAER